MSSIFWTKAIFLEVILDIFILLLHARYSCVLWSNNGLLHIDGLKIFVYKSNLIWLFWGRVSTGPVPIGTVTFLVQKGLPFPMDFLKRLHLELLFGSNWFCFQIRSNWNRNRENRCNDSKWVRIGSERNRSRGNARPIRTKLFWFQLEPWNLPESLKICKNCLIADEITAESHLILCV